MDLQKISKGINRMGMCPLWKHGEIAYPSQGQEQTQQQSEKFSVPMCQVSCERTSGTQERKSLT